MQPYMYGGANGGMQENSNSYYSRNADQYYQNNDNQVNVNWPPHGAQTQPAQHQTMNNDNQQQYHQVPLVPNFSQPPPEIPPGFPQAFGKQAYEKPSYRENRRRSRSNSMDRRRSRSRSRDRGRRRDYHHRSRSRSPSSKYSRRRRSRSTSRNRLQNKRKDEWNFGTPSKKLVILNIPVDVDNAKITISLGEHGYLPKDVRTLKKYDKSIKQSKMFAFIEFNDVTTAKRWMDENQGCLTLTDGRQLFAEYAKSENCSLPSKREDDWICANCSMNNFVKRQNCFKCDISREQSFELESQGVHMVGVSPCDTLLVRGLPETCTTDHLYDIMGSKICSNSISLIKMSESNRFAYVQLKSTDEATMLLNMLYKNPVKIGNKDVQVTYCRDSIAALIHQQLTALTQGTIVPQNQANLTGAEIAAAAMQKAYQIRQASKQLTNPTTPVVQATTLTPNYPPPHPTGGVIGTTPTPKGIKHQYVQPNPSQFILDNNSGYYIDPVTNFYYDSKTGYYFENATQTWCVFDNMYQTYMPVEESAPSVEEVKKERKEEDEKDKSAADVAKDMLKWARKQEKEKMKVQLSLKMTPKVESKNVFAMEKRKNVIADDDDDEPEEPEKKQEEEKEQQPTASTRQTYEEMIESKERAFIDEPKKMCLLCKRAFPSVDVLGKHVDKSELHKSNLAAKRAEWEVEWKQQMIQEEEEAKPAKFVYRDRARERRQQFGSAFDARPSNSLERKEDVVRKSEEAAARPIDDSNIGNRLLKSMGWKEGQGVGKHAQGIVNPIQAERFVQGAGLGAANSRLRSNAEASHKEKTKAALFSRYHLA